MSALARSAASAPAQQQQQRRPQQQQQQQRPAGVAHRRRAVACRASSSTQSSSSIGKTRMTVGSSNLRPTSPQGWEAMKRSLREGGVVMVAPQEVSGLQRRGAVLVDVRPRGDYARARVPGALSAPIYRLIEGWSFEQTMRRLGYALFGVFHGTEVNDAFLSELSAAVQQAAAAPSPPSSGPRVVLYCSQGGSIDPVGAAAVAAAAGPVPGGAGGGAGGRRGWQSRSLVAAYALLDGLPEEYAGGRVGVLRGGFSDWVRGGRQVEGQEVEAEGASG